MEHFPAINWLAVFVAAIVMFILGGLWYSPFLFAKRWIALMNRTEEQMRADMAAANMPVMYISAFVCAFVTAVVMGHFIAHLAELNVVVPSAAHGALFGFVCWLGFAAPTSYATAIFSSTAKQKWVIDTGYNLVSFVLAGIILAVWR